MSNLISPQEAYGLVQQGAAVLADCRFALGQPKAGREAYMESHLPGAYYFDLEQDLSGHKSAHGGRHPLPDLEELALKLGTAGIADDALVIAYDDQGGAMASRFWWLLRYLGHNNVKVLDGGIPAWKAAGLPVTDELPEPNPRPFRISLQPDRLVDVEDVKAGLGRSGRTLIDSREAKRYLGEEESIDPAAGHIPGAVNRFWKDSLEADGSWRNAAGQRERFAGVDPGGELVVYCGSGVTATPNVLALEEAGFKNVKLYLGSWSDWVSYPDNPIAVGDEEEPKDRPPHGN